ncbi:MAG: CYTH domain-containing protein [Flavobacteriales bacterium]|jgi:adenylate cyclase|uniref:CYTH domain-containing protein n=1 Tax=Candidatus Ulvibacter alkanivorans TaxID=2267620 RepID=UPI000DF3593E|nr:CYTH domain-containing protein [Candidatus Ulvibacter alkanivorans]MCH2489799.1 CYTH domain-containing protein [Flavobacteriales bacterium]
MIEIERKFLVTSEAYKSDAFKTTHIKQAFLNRAPERTVRVRIRGNEGFITVKGKGNESGTSRFEWEKMITVKEAEALFEICEPGIIEKMRYEVKAENHIFEVDEFLGENEGLTIAEVELSNEDELYAKPSWLGDEVTGQKKYYNSQISKQPYNTWKHEK